MRKVPQQYMTKEKVRSEVDCWLNPWNNKCLGMSGKLHPEEEEDLL
jgi:hypothetical protein